MLADGRVVLAPYRFTENRPEALRLYERGKGATLGDVARLLELASRLGRLASGLATDKTEVTGEEGGPIRVEFEAALRKVAGDVAGAPARPEPA